MFIRPLRYVLAVITLALGLLWLVSQWSSATHTAYATTGNTYVVNSTLDEPDADPSSGVCFSTPSGKCTLRAAIMLANFATGPQTITLPAGVYLLTRPGQDDAALVGDLDISDDLTVQGAGPTSTIVDGNGAVTGDRAFEILATAKTVRLTGLTIRNGQAQFGNGGALLVHGHGLGSLLQMNDVVLENNHAVYGGGLAADYTGNAGSMILDTIILRNNVADEDGGGLAALVSYNLNFVTIRNSQVYSNMATFDGGGIRINGDLGGRTKSVGDWMIESSRVYSNVAQLGAGIATPGISFLPATTTAFQLTVLDSHLYNNHATSGGAIINGDALVVSRSTLDGNSATDEGGAIYSTRSGQTANQLTIVQSTLNDNSAHDGGGLTVNAFTTQTVATLMNSTLSGNAAAEFGGGVYARGDGTRFQAFNTTIAGNQVLVPLHAGHGGIGAGLYITLSAVITTQNTLLAYNSTRIGIGFPTPDDCFGLIHSLGFNLIQTLDNCTVSTVTTSDIFSLDPLLGPLAFNGGPTQTRALLPGSPAIDTGQRPCMDANHNPITTDQRGFARPVGISCDIGAFEYYPPGLFLPLILR